MEEREVVELIGGLPGVAALTVEEGSEAPEIAWGDSFFYYDPDGDRPQTAMPFATIVVKDYPGFDTESRVDRDGAYRVNLHVGAAEFESLFGFAPKDLDAHRAEFDFAALDRVVPHPVYGPQGYVAVVSPGPHSEPELRRLTALAHANARHRHTRRDT